MHCPPAPGLVADRTTLSGSRAGRARARLAEVVKVDASACRSARSAADVNNATCELQLRKRNAHGRWRPTTYMRILKRVSCALHWSGLALQNPSGRRRQAKEFDAMTSSASATHGEWCCRVVHCGAGERHLIASGLLGVGTSKRGLRSIQGCTRAAPSCTVDGGRWSYLQAHFQPPRPRAPTRPPPAGVGAPHLLPHSAAVR